MATNYKNSTYDYISGHQTVPAAGTKTGLCITAGTAVTGTGTKFLSEMRAGSWLVDLAHNEIRKVVRVDSDTLAYIDKAFTTSLASAAPSVIIESDTNISTISVSILATAAAAGVVDGKVFPKGGSITFSKDSRTTSSMRDFIDPIIVDASETTMLVLTCK